ncbi:hypothetical protein N752_27120 [Desulforamulus aquiferis]|nr:hypothetical protein [Desulforamulus aquiferis]RYD02125.1 hypothetical protein N752_27120 [Desulforamulus aquiferis]
MKLKEVLRKALLKRVQTFNKEEMMVPADYWTAYLSSAYLGLFSAG